MGIYWRLATWESSGLMIFFAILTFGTRSFAHDNPSGYISIDCGSVPENSTDPHTNLLWVGDGDYIITGENGLIQDKQMSLVDPTVDNYEALKSFRYFPEEGISKYCYVLPKTTSNASFLLRAMFLHGNATELSLPTFFGLYLNGSYLGDVFYPNDTGLSVPIVLESIFPPSDGPINVCLLPASDYGYQDYGIPFISSLELRELDPGGIMYRESFGDLMREGVFFTNMMRWNPGASNTSTVRYPYDPYDRLWAYPQGWTLLQNTLFQNISSQQTFSKTGPEINSVPSEVMKDAWTAPIATTVYIPLPSADAGTFANGIFYFALLNESTRNPQTVNLALDTVQYPSFNITRQPSQQSHLHVLNGEYIAIQFNDPFTLNAVEFYQAQALYTPTTNLQDVANVNHIKDIFNMTQWQGDPCMPIPYDWIECYLSYEGNQYNVVGLFLSHLTNGSRLIELNSSDENWDLVDISIINSSIDFGLFQFIFSDWINASQLYTMNMSFNTIDMFPDGNWWRNLAGGIEPWPLYSLDLSSNQLKQIPTFKDFPFSSNLQILNLSQNFITGNFPNQTFFSNLSSLEWLNFSFNNFVGNIPWSLSSQNLPNLTILDISNNNFTGEFPSDFYFGSNGSFQSLYADNNEFTGVLNLRPWFTNLQMILSNNSSSNVTTYSQLFSFVNNKIQSIDPSAEEFHYVIARFIDGDDFFNQSGVLLGGNPYCTDAKNFTQRYLCRSSIQDYVTSDSSPSNNSSTSHTSSASLVIGLSTVSGALLFITGSCCLLGWFHRRRQKENDVRNQTLSRMEVLQEMQSKGGANICKMYTLEELKKATSNFAESNVVGIGGYGKIYKGTLDDGLEVAIKKAKRDVGGGRDDTKQFINEVTILSTVNHNNLVKLLGCCLETPTPILVYEFICNGSLKNYIERSKSRQTSYAEEIREEFMTAPESLDWDQRLKIAVGTAGVISYLHSGTSPPIYHRDVKSANILLDKKYVAKVADFGLSKFVPVDSETMHLSTAVQGTPGYLDPEYFENYQITEKSDVFSFGVVLLELLTGEQAIDFSRPVTDQILATRCRRLWNFGLFEEIIDPSLKKSSNPRILEDIHAMAKVAIQCVKKQGKDRPAIKEAEDQLRKLGALRNLPSSSQSSNVDDQNAMQFITFDDDIPNDDIPDIYDDSTPITSGTFTNSADQMHGMHLASSTFGLEMTSIRQKQRHVI